MRKRKCSGVFVVGLGFWASLVGAFEVRAEAIFCRKPKAEVHRLQLELGEKQLEVIRVQGEVKERDQSLAMLTGQLELERAEVRSLKREIALLRGEEGDVLECSALSRSDLMLAPVGMRCRYGAQADAIAEKVESLWTPHAWRDRSGLVWDLARNGGKNTWVVADQACKEQRGRLPEMGELRRAEASGFLTGVIHPVRGFDEIHTRTRGYTATLRPPVQFEYHLEVQHWGDFPFVCVWR